MSRPAPLPPLEFVRRVRGGQADLAQYLAGGYEAAAAVLDALALSGLTVPEDADALDFACGCGRLTRWLAAERPRWRLRGLDADAEMVAWCRRAFPRMGFDACPPAGPAPLPSASLDLVVAVSIFNHFDEPAQDAWLAELRRLLRPGGAAVVTFHGPELSAALLRGAERRAFLRRGFHYREEASAGWGTRGAYPSAYHSRAYVERVWTRGWRLRAYVSFGCDHWQDVVVLEKTDASARGARPVEAALPMARVLGAPHGERVRVGRLALRGWALHPDGGPCRLEASIDGRRAGACAADLPRGAALSPEEAAWGGELLRDILERFPAAPRSGFRLELDAAGLEPGPHALEVRSTGPGGTCPVRFTRAAFEVER